MVGHAGLRVVVSADFCRTVSGGDHGLSLCGNLVKILLVLHIVEPRTELCKSLVKVLELRLLVLTLYHDSRRDVGEPDCRVGRVHGLSART